jgi:tetratricopeptide (TPR) repeat protein
LLTLDVALGHGTLTGADPMYLDGIELALRDAITSGDPLALALAWTGKGNHAWMSGQFAETYRLNRLALVYAREAGDTRLELDLELNNVVEAIVGPTPASDAAALAEQLVARTAAFPTVRAQALQLLAFAEAMLDRPGEAREHSTEAIRILGDLAQSAAVANAWFDRSWVERLAGDLPAAEDALRRALREPGAQEERFFRSLAACRLAQVLVAERQFAEAAEVLTEVEAFPVPTNAPRVAGLRARINAAGGDRGAAGAVDALVGMIPEASYVLIRTDALVDAAETMVTLGETERARSYAIQAIEVAQAKENLAPARQMREFVARLPE